MTSRKQSNAASSNVVQLRAVQPIFPVGGKQRSTKKTSKAAHYPDFLIVYAEDNFNKGRYFEIEFTPDGKYAAHKAILDATGVEYVRNLMTGSMYSFGKKYGVAYCYTFDDDALVHTLKELEIDPKQFQHFSSQVPKRSVDSFVERVCRMVKNGSIKLLTAKSDTARSANFHKLHPLWTAWREEDCVRHGCDLSWHCGCDDWYPKIDVRKVGDYAVKRAKSCESVQLGPR